jgi:phage baseplate assembly protein gpV
MRRYGATENLMKKLLILICALAIGTAAFAAPAKSAPASAHFTGTIEKYDTATKTLTVKHDGKDTVFQINDKSQVMNGKSKADASALAASTGQSVKIDYTMDGSTKVAEKIDVTATHVTHTAPAKTMKKK